MNIDILIISVFLALNLIAGIYHGQNIKNLKEYAVGDRNFSTAALTATIIATWISGSFFAISVSETYKEGIWGIIPGIGQVFSLLFTARILVPRMKMFFGSLSVAESMGQLYGRKVRLVTSIASIAQAIGFTAIQIKVFSTIFNYFFGIEAVWATILSSFIVIIYSGFGGIKSVTFTDVLQFITFGVFIPLFALFVWGAFGNLDQVVDAFATNPLLDFSQLLNFSHPKFLPYLFITFYCMTPAGLTPTMFQRVLMAKNVAQATKSFTTAAILCLVLHLISCFIGVIVLIDNPNLNASNIVMHVVDTYSFTGLKGITVVGIIAMLMSTADSWINVGAVIFTNDFLKSLGFAIKPQHEILFSRMFSFFVGSLAILLALAAPSFLKLVLLQANFYIPIVLIPLLLAIFGFRSTSRVTLISMACGITTVIIWRWYIQPVTNIESVIPAMIANLIGFLSAHYLLKEPGGWGAQPILPNQNWSLSSKF